MSAWSSWLFVILFVLSTVVVVEGETLCSEDNGIECVIRSLDETASLRSSLVKLNATVVVLRAVVDELHATHSSSIVDSLVESVVSITTNLEEHSSESLSRFVAVETGVSDLASVVATQANEVNSLESRVLALETVTGGPKWFETPQYSLLEQLVGNGGCDFHYHVPSESYGPYCYKYFPVGKTQDEAEDWCEEWGGHLMSIHKQGEQDLLSKFIKDDRTVRWFSYVWIGLTRTSTGSHRFKWYGESGDFPKTDFDAYWDTNEGLSTNELGVLVYYPNGKWRDYGTTSVQAFVCKRSMRV